MRDLLLALRAIRRNPGFAALVIGTMALGIGANTTMYSIVRAVFLRPLPFPQQDRLVTLWEKDSVRGIDARRVTPANFVDWRAQSRSFEEMGVLPNWSGPVWHFNIAGDAGTERVAGIYASSGFFRVLGVPPLFGGPSTKRTTGWPAGVASSSAIGTGRSGSAEIAPSSVRPSTWIPFAAVLSRLSA